MVIFSPWLGAARVQEVRGKHLKQAKQREKTARAVTDVDRLVGENVRRFRHEQGLTLSELSLALGISHQQLQKYETGMNRLSAGSVLEVSKLLNVPVAHLFESADPKPGQSRSQADAPRRVCQAILSQTESPKKLELMARVLKAIRDTPLK